MVNMPLFEVAHNRTFGLCAERVATGEPDGIISLRLGVAVSWWMPRSSKPAAGCAEQAAVGSTPIHSRFTNGYLVLWNPR